jgi:hypothetical protein
MDFFMETIDYEKEINDRNQQAKNDWQMIVGDNCSITNHYHNLCETIVNHYLKFVPWLAIGN